MNSYRSACKFALTLAAIFLASATSTQVLAQSNEAVDQNVILVVADGLRWHEVFRGMDADMLTTANGVKDPNALRDLYDAPTTEARRAKLMPFLWDHVERSGQIYGNRDKNSSVRVTNGHWFSYPGYNELLTGYPDDVGVTSNEKIMNPNLTVFEWLNSKPQFKGRVAAFGAWDVFPYIFNVDRSGLIVDGGDKPFVPPQGVTCGMEMLNRLRQTLPYRWESAAYDALVFPMLAEYMRHTKPRVLFLCLGETDEWAHEGDYPHYLRAANQSDSWLRQLWEMTQSMPEYRGKTAFIFVADHGRGDKSQSPKAWNGHGRENAGSDAVWMAIWGPKTPPKGEIADHPEVALAQTTASVAAAVGLNYRAEQPKALPPVEAAFTGK